MAHRRAQLVYEDDEREFTERRKSLWTNAPNPRKSLSTVKTAVFGVSYGLPPFASQRGLIRVCWIVLYAVRKSCVKMTFVVWNTEGKSVLCVCSIRFITERTTL